ncbi:MAG TPA: MlaD family protein [Candidatus Dormibacteraeota bacterium]|jgi:phospholipid/cholesterol/gamma-HCH transport system substrate-binding protein
MTKGKTRFNVVLTVAFAALCLGGLGYISLNMGLNGPWNNDFRLEAQFDSANGLVPQAEVRVSGVHVGTVVSIGDSSDGGATVRMNLQPGIQLRQDTRAVIRPKTLLGEKFVELVRQQGSSLAYLPSGASIPKSQTGQAVEIDDILNAMDAPTRKAMSESFRELGIALDGRQQDVSQALGPLDTTLANFRPLARVGENRQKELDRILTNLNTIMQALADEQDQLGHVVDSGDTVMAAIASRDQALAGTVRNGAALFGSLDQAFAGLTPADRASLQKSPPTIAAGRRMLSLTNPQVDQLLPELLLAQISYPNDQLNITDAESLTLASEWISAFSQQDPVSGYHSLRITGLTPSTVKPSAGAQGSRGAAPGVPTAPLDLSQLLLQTLEAGR